MNKQLLLRFTKLALVMALFVAVSASLAAFAQKRGDASDQLPHGQWSVSCKPYMGVGYKSLPVLVTSVTSELDKGVGITKVGIENTTSQPLAAVKLSWYLSTQENPEAVLQQGQTRFLRLPGGIQAGEAREVLFPLVSFAKVSGALARNGIVNGNYSIQVAVSEARFEDGSTKILMASGNGKPHTAGFIKAAYRVAPTAQHFVLTKRVRLSGVLLTNC